MSYDGEVGRPPGTLGWRGRPPARPRSGQAARDGPADVSGEVTGALQSSLATGGRGGPPGQERREPLGRGPRIAGKSVALR